MATEGVEVLHPQQFSLASPLVLIKHKDQMMEDQTTKKRSIIVLVVPRSVGQKKTGFYFEETDIIRKFQQ